MYVAPGRRRWSWRKNGCTYMPLFCVYYYAVLLLVLWSRISHRELILRSLSRPILWRISNCSYPYIMRTHGLVGGRCLWTHPQTDIHVDVCPAVSVALCHSCMFCLRLTNLHAWDECMLVQRTEESFQNDAGIQGFHRPTAIWQGLLSCSFQTSLFHL